MRTLAKTGVTGVALALSASVLGMPAAHAGPVVPDADSGVVEVWGPGDTLDPRPFRAHFGASSLVGVAAGGQSDAVRLGITPAGGLKVLAGSDNPLVTNRPAELATEDVEGVELSLSAAMAWSADGDVYSWASQNNRRIDVSTVTGHVEQVALGTTWALVRTSDGRVQGVGRSSVGALDLPAELTDPGAPGFSPAVDIAAGGSVAAAVRADGSVRVWGALGGQPERYQPPADLGAVERISVGPNDSPVVALMKDGSVRQWATDSAAASPPSGTDFTQVESGGKSAAAVREDGSIAVWSTSGEILGARQAAVPAELEGRRVAQLAFGQLTYSALVAGPATGADVVQTSGADLTGTAQAGRTLTAVPATFAGATQVQHVWLADGSVVAGENGPTLALTPALVGKRLVYRSIGTAGNASAASDSDPTAPVQASDVLAVTSKGAVTGTMKVGEKLTATPATFSDPSASVAYQWLVNDKPVTGATALTYTLRPEDANATSVSFQTTGTAGDRVAVDTVTRAEAVAPAAALAMQKSGRITGTPKVGQKLTGTPAVFNDPEATVTVQWLVGGQAVPGATGATFTPTAAHVGKRVTLRSTAKRGTETATNTSAPTANVAAATVPKASTSVAVSGATTAAYGSTVRWTVTVRGGSPAGGTVTVAGSGVNVRAAVSRGRAVVTLPRTLAPASRTLCVTYSGDGTHLASYRNLGLRVVKANVSAAAKVTKKPTSRKAGKVRVTVRGAGPVRAGGRVTVTIQKGSKRYTVRGNVRSNGTVDLKLRKLKKGTWTVKAVYAGDARYNARAAKSVRVKVSK